MTASASILGGESSSVESGDRGVRPFHDFDERAERFDVDARCEVVSKCTRQGGDPAAAKVEDRRRPRGDVAVRREVEEMRIAELVGTSAASVVPGFPRAFGRASTAMGSAVT
jgi:hypothetical protein